MAAACGLCFICNGQMTLLYGCSCKELEPVSYTHLDVYKRQVYSGHEGKKGGFAVGVDLLAGGRSIFDKCSLVWLKTVKWILG